MIQTHSKKELKPCRGCKGLGWAMFQTIYDFKKGLAKNESETCRVCNGKGMIEVNIDLTLNSDLG